MRQVDRSNVARRGRRRIVWVATLVGMLAAVVAPGSVPVAHARVARGSVTEVKVAGQAGVPADAVAVAVNIAAVDPVDAGYLSAYPCGGASPTTSTVNHDLRYATSNSAIVKIGAGGKICVYSMSPADIVVDVTGWFAAGSGYTSLDPVRLVDTRSDHQPVIGGSTREIQVTGRAGIPNNAAAVAVNLAAVDPLDAGYLSAYPCGSAAATASTVNHDLRHATSNAAMVKIGSGGKICVYSMSTTDIVVDVAGWFAAGSGYTSLNPLRLLDSRTTTRLGTASTREVQITGRAGIPTGTTAVAVNLAAVAPAAPGYLSAFPCGGPASTTSTVNYDTSYATSNSAIVKLGTGGKICIYSMSAADIVIDVTGYFAGSGYTPLDPSRLLDTRGSTGSGDDTGVRPALGGAQFVATFDNNSGLNQFRYGVYHRAVGFREAGQPEPFFGPDNNSLADGTWTGDHDLACGGPDTQRTLRSESTQDTTGAFGWRPTLDFHTDELVYVCKDHLMDSMGAVSGYSVVWFSPNAVFNSVSQVNFDVNLTDLGGRKWWKVAVVSDALFNSSYGAGWNGAVKVPGFMFADVGASDLDGNLAGPDRLAVTWSGAASAGYPGCLKIGNTKTGTCVNPTPTDKATRHPVSLVDNRNGTVTFTVAGVSTTAAGSFPACPCRVVFYDHNYTPDKDGVPIGHTWHWDNITVR